MVGHVISKRPCGAGVKSRPWDHDGCQRRALDWSDRCRQHAGPQTIEGRTRSNEALVKGRKTALANRAVRADKRRQAKEAAKAWARDFGHPAGPMVIALFEEHHPTHKSVLSHAHDLIATARAGYDV